MFRPVFLAFFGAFLAASLVGLPPAVAQPQRAPGVQPLDRVLPQVRSRYPGTFYDADGPYTDERGSSHYRLKWMTPEGRVMWLDTDARTGRVLGVDRNGGGRGRYAAPPPDERAPPGYYDGRPRGGYYDDGGYPGGRAPRGGGNWGGGRGNWRAPRGGGHGGHGHGY